MDWFDLLRTHTDIETVIITDTRGRIVRASRLMSSKDELVASMIQAAEVLAQTLATEFNRGPLQMLQISTASRHLLIFPLAFSAYHLTVITHLDAPVQNLIELIEQMIPGIDPHTLASQEDAAPQSALDTAVDDSDLDAAELIEAVREWLHNRSSHNNQADQDE